jgi:N-acetylneuraminic acid mutarotase
MKPFRSKTTTLVARNSISRSPLRRGLFLILFALACFGLSPSAQAVRPQVGWEPANPMNKARSFFVAVELLNGNVLVAGGFDGTVDPPVFADAEIYNWHTGEWTSISPMNTARAAPVALRLEDGRVMVMGGADEFFNVLNSVEIYEPRTDTWSVAAPMNDARFEDFIAVLLPGHRVLVAGGIGSDFLSLSSAEIYDEATNTWTQTGSMNVARQEFAGNPVVLGDGRVLAIGGLTEDFTPTATAEIYNSVSGVWTLTGSMNIARADHAAVRLHDGRVLVAGGDASEEEPRFKSAEIFDPHTGQWTMTGDMTTGRSESEYAVVLLPDGRVLVPGGHTDFDTPVSSADLYDPRTGTWSDAGSMSDSRAGHSAVVLHGNRGVLVMGGLNSPPAATASVDIFQSH